MIRIVYLLFLALPFFWGAEVVWNSGLKDNFSAKISIPSASLTINETLPLSLELIYPKTYKPDIDSLRLNIFKTSGVEISPFSLASEKIFPSSEISSEILKQKLIFYLDLIVPGTHYLALQEITFLPLDRKKASFQIIPEIFKISVTMPKTNFDAEEFIQPLLQLKQTIPIEINSLNQKEIFNNTEEQQREIKRNKLLFHRKEFPWTGIAFILLAGLVFLALKTRPSLPLLKPEPITTAHIQTKTLAAIDRLNEEQLIETRQYDRFFTRLSSLVRNFVEQRYHIRSSTYTTQEFLNFASKSPILDDQKKDKLQEFLNSSDRVKFAKYDPSPEECEQALKTARGFIKT